MLNSGIVIAKTNDDENNFTWAHELQIYQFICVINRKAQRARTLEFVNFSVQVRPQKHPTTYSGTALRAANWLDGNSKGFEEGRKRP